MIEKTMSPLLVKKSKFSELEKIQEEVLDEDDKTLTFWDVMRVRF